VHIAAEESLGLPGSYSDAFALLARHDVIIADLGKRFEGVVRVHNRVVHGYATVAPARFWNDLPAGIAALTEFAAAIAAFARKLGPDPG